MYVIEIYIVVLNLFMYISIILSLYLCMLLSFGVSLLRFKYPATLKNCK